MEQRELTCIGCPMGCQITVTLEEGAVTKLTGNTCQVGDQYARNEVVNPMRTVTSTVRVLQGELPVVSVKTRTEIPKTKIMAVMEALRQVEIEAPVHMGAVVVSDVCETGVDVIATKEVRQKV